MKSKIWTNKEIIWKHNSGRRAICFSKVKYCKKGKMLISYLLEEKIHLNKVSKFYKEKLVSKNKNIMSLNLDMIKDKEKIKNWLTRLRGSRELMTSCKKKKGKKLFLDLYRSYKVKFKMLIGRYFRYRKPWIKLDSKKILLNSKSDLLEKNWPRLQKQTMGLNLEHHRIREKPMI